MPTTLVGLLIFVVLLVPGFAYLVGKERNGTERRASPFRETVAIVAASITSEILVLALFGITRWRLASLTPDVGALVRNPGNYLVGTETSHGHYAEVGAWALGMLALSTLIAYWATCPRIRRAATKLPLVGSYPHDSTVSAWWMLFEKWPRKREVEVGCLLEDGSYIRGMLASFNTSADDTPDRDLVLTPPIIYQRPGSDRVEPFEVSAVCISADKITCMFVGYELAESSVTPPQEQQEQAAQPAGGPVGVKLSAAIRAWLSGRRSAAGLSPHEE